MLNPVFRYLFLLLLAAPLSLSAALLDAEIQSIVESGSSSSAHWGVYAEQLSTGRALADRNSAKLFIPASNRKLVTSALAARFLGPGHSPRTLIHTPSPPSAGVINGDLTIKATGDPSWSAEFRGGRPGISVMQSAARQLKDAGIETIRGGLVIDASRFVTPAIVPPGWEWEDFQTIYGSIPSVFGVDSNLAAVTVKPGRAGEPAGITFPAMAKPFELINESITGRPGSAPTFTLSRGLDGRFLTAKGSIPADAAAARRSMPAGRPVEFAAEQFLAVLRGEGITVEGSVTVTSEEVPVGEVLAVVPSAELPRMMDAMNKPSDNFLAESIYLLAGAELFGRGSYEASHKAEERIWESLDVPANEWVAVDGSGLSRRNLVTPRALVKLLTEYEEEDYFVESLPVSGKSGTLRYRLAENGMAGRVKAKTGTLTGVSALSGYVTSDAGQTVVFSILVNNYSSSVYSIRRDMNSIVELLARRG